MSEIKKQVKNSLRTEHPQNHRSAHNSSTDLNYFIDEYKEKNGNGSDDYTTLSMRKKNKLNDFLTIAITALFLLLAVAIAGFFIFKPEIKTGNKVELSLVSTDEVISGKEIDVKIKIRNQEPTDIGQIITEVFIPDNFVLKKVDPAEEDLTKKRFVFKTDKIGVGESKEIILTGIVLGDVGEEVIINAQTAYKPIALNSEYQIKNTKTIKITDALVKIEANIDNKIFIQQEADYAFTIRNTSKNTLQNTVIRLEKPFGFIISKPAPTNKDTAKPGKAIYDSVSSSWKIDTLESEEELQIAFKGTLGTTNVDAVDFVITVAIPDGDSERIVTRVKKTAFVVQPKLEIELKADGSVESTQQVSWEEVIEYQAILRNTSQDTIKNVRVEIPTISKLLDFSSLTSKDKISLDKEKRSVVWTSAEIPTLAEFKPNDVVTLSWNIKIINKPTDLSSYKADDLQFNLSLEATSEVVDEVSPTPPTPTTVSIESKPMLWRSFASILFMIDNQVAFDSYVLYHGADKKPILGGALPPKVGQETGYQVVWKLSSQPNSLEKVVVYAEVPAYVLWKGVVSGGDDLSYNQNTHEVRWVIGSLLGDGKVHEVRFNVGIVPGESDTGRSMTLVQTTRLNAEDALTHKAVSVTSALLSTNLIKDPKIIGQGVVTE